MEAKTNYTIVGIIVLVLMVSLISTMLWLSVGFNQKSYSFYTVYFHEPASGLAFEAPVRYNGVQVGYVKQIKLNNNDPRQVEIILAIEKDTPITTSTSATLISQGITGVTYIGLSAASADLTPLQKMPGEPYPVIPAKPSLLNQLDRLLKEVSEGVNDISVEAQHIFNEENATYIRKILANTEQLTALVIHNNKKINNTIKNMDVFIENLTQASHNFPHIMKNLDTGITKFNIMAESLSKAGTSVTKTMGSGRSTLDKFSQETLAPAAILLQRLSTISANIEKVSSEMRQNPSVIIRGSAAPKPGPGE